MKYSYAPSRQTASIEVCLDAEAISLYTTNSIAPVQVESFQAFIQRLLTEHPDELYME